MPSVDDILGPSPAAPKAAAKAPRVDDILGPSPSTAKLPRTQTASVDSILGPPAPQEKKPGLTSLVNQVVSGAIPQRAPTTKPVGGPGDWANTYKTVVDENLKSFREQLKGPATKPGTAPRWFDAPLHGAATAGAYMGYLASPLQAAGEELGRPVEYATPASITRGRGTRAATGLAASMFMPGGEGVSAADRLPGAMVKAAKGAKESPLGAMAGAVQKTFAPETVSERSRAVAEFIRGAGARSQLQVEKTARKLLPLDQRLQRGTPEQSKAFIDFMENRSKFEGDKGMFVSHPGVKAPFTMSASDVAEMKKFGLTSEDVEAANEIRSAYKSYRDQAEYLIKRNSGAAPQFIKDYFTHNWMESPEVVEQKMQGFFKQGSGRNFRARTIPTISDGLEAGLTPRYSNPIEATIVYSQNMSNFLKTHDVLGFMKENGHAQWFKPGQQPAGWVPLEGILTERRPRVSGTPGSPRGEMDWQPAPGRLGGPGQGALPPGGKGPGSLGVELNEIEELKRLGGPGKLPAVQDILGPDPRLGGAEKPRIEGPSMRNITPEPEPIAAPKKGVGDRPVSKEVLYAPEDAARVYNRSISKGFESSTSVGNGFAAARKATNATTALKLGMSAFHGVVMAQEAAVSSVARGIKAATRGDLVTAGKSIAQAPTAMLTSGLRGRKMGQQLLDLKNATPFEKKINEAFINSGGRIRMDKLYRTTDGRTFYDAVKSKTLNKELANAWERMAGPDKTTLERGKAIVSTAANVVQSVFQGPLFEDIIPAVKRGAFAESMGDFLKANPTASEQEITRYATRLQDSVDNRFGELVQDNLFWHKRMKQTAQLLLTSPTWDVGTVREIGGGLADVLGPSVKEALKGKGVTDRTAYVVALVAVVATENAFIQELKTGKKPSSPQDLMAYQTGGVDDRLGGAPERGLIPGYQKDVFAAADAMKDGSDGPLGMLRSKLSPAAGAVLDVISNSDYAGHKLYGAGAREGALADEAINFAMPISVGMFAKGTPKGSNISPLEQSLAIRPAPLSITNPEGLARVREARTKRERKAAEKSERRREERYSQ